MLTLFALFSIGLYWRRNLPFPFLNSHDTAPELVLNSLFCQDAVFAHCSFLLWFYTNDFMHGPPMAAAGFGYRLMHIAALWPLESCRRARRRPLITHKVAAICSLECCRGLARGGFVPFLGRSCL